MKWIVLVALALAACSPASAASGTSLKITVWPEGRPGPSTTSTLRCNPVGGTLPRRAEACRRLLAMNRPFRPVPADAICTEIYGGPQVAFVRGTLRGRSVSTWFNRKNGCHISRWDRVAFLFPGANA